MHLYISVLFFCPWVIAFASLTQYILSPTQICPMVIINDSTWSRTQNDSSFKLGWQIGLTIAFLHLGISNFHRGSQREILNQTSIQWTQQSAIIFSRKRIVLSPLTNVFKASLTLSTSETISMKAVFFHSHKHSPVNVSNFLQGNVFKTLICLELCSLYSYPEDTWTPAISSPFIIYLSIQFNY